MNGSQHALLARIIAAALIGALIGILDFILFELHKYSAGFTEHVLYKPDLFGLSMLSFQFIAFTVLGVLSFCLCSLLWFILGKLVRNLETFLVLPISSAALAFGMIALRVRWNEWHAQGLVTSLVGSAVLVAYAFLFDRSRARAPSSFAARFSWSPRLACVVMLFLIGACLFSPDVYSWYLSFRYHPTEPHDKAPNVLFIVLDTVRADHLSCYGYQRLTTPNIDRISRESVLFSNAFSAAPWTLPSHTSMFTGLYLSQHQVDWGHGYLDKGFQTLAEHVRDAGYQTVGFSENPSVGFFSGLNRGFGEFHETWRRPLVVRVIVDKAKRVFHYKERLEYAERSVGLLERWLSNNKRRGKPFFAFLNLMAAHNPRYPRSTSGSRNWARERLVTEPVNVVLERYYLPKYKVGERELAIMVDLYDSEISYLDTQIGALMSFLGEAGILDKTIVILTSDHGENFGEHGLLGHQFCLYDTLLHVPLMFRYPASLKPQRIDKSVSTVFLFKTVMALVGAPGGGGSDPSRMDALGALQGQEAVIAECSNGIDHLKGLVGEEGAGVDLSRFDRNLKCVIDGGYKFIWASSGKHELYRIGEDPHEAENLIEKEQDRARALDQLLESWELSAPTKNLF